MVECLAFDFGAGSGRAVVVRLEGGRLGLSEVARFPSAEYRDALGLRWSAATLCAQLEAGLKAAGPGIASVGIDTWGLDFGLLDGAGRLIEDPFHYRDARSLRGHAASPLPEDDLARQTDAQVLEVNTLFQLIALQRERPEVLARARRMLMMADLLAHHLTGVAANELTLARTSGLHGWRPEGWRAEILGAAGLAPGLVAPTITPGTQLGILRPDVARGRPDLPVITVAGHDTASAVAALPLQPGEAFLVAGSWNLLGIETDTPPEGFAARGFGLEGGAEGRALMTRSLAGFVLMRRLSEATGLGFAALSAAGRAALRDPLPAPLETGDPSLLTAGFQGDPGRLTLALYLGLAEAIADGLTRLEELGAAVTALRIGGGGAQDPLFREILAARIDRAVILGPIEASAMGNGLFQLIGLGHAADLAEARALVAASIPAPVTLPDRALRARL